MILRKGSSGAGVEALTGDLVELGLLARPSPVFDRVVDLAVRAFQAQHLDPRGEPLAIDGIVGPLTRAALDAARARRPEPVPARPDLAAPDLAASGEAARIGRVTLDVALAEYRRGAGEAGGNNCGPDIRTYLDGRAAEGADWCAGFVSWCFREAAAKLGRPMPFVYSLGARDIRNQFRRRGWDYLPGPENLPRGGDIVVWWRGAATGWQGHIGLVHSCADGILTTIEGNRGAFPSKVGRFRYVLSRMDRLLGFGRTTD